MKDYIVLTPVGRTAENDGSMSWEINPSCFKHIKPNNRLKVKLVSCGMDIDNATTDAVGGIYPIFCSLPSANITTDCGYSFLGAANCSVKYINPKYWIYTDYLESSVEILTNQFSKIKIWTSLNGVDFLAAEFDLIVLEISYYDN